MCRYTIMVCYYYLLSLWVFFIIFSFLVLFLRIALEDVLYCSGHREVGEGGDLGQLCWPLRLNQLIEKYYIF